MGHSALNMDKAELGAELTGIPRWGQIKPFAYEMKTINPDLAMPNVLPHKNTTDPDLPKAELEWRPAESSQLKVV